MPFHFSLPVFLRALVCLLWLVSQTVSAGGQQQTLLVVGDSLSAGSGVEVQDTWVALLQNRLTEQGYGYRVVNASISGDTTSGGLRRLPRALKVHQPEILVIELGGNDGLRATPINVMKGNLAAMIELAQEQNIQVVLAGMLIPPNYGIEYTEEFSGAFAGLADEYPVALFPFFMEGVALNPELMQADNIHPNKKAQPVLLENVWTALAPLLVENRTNPAANTSRVTDNKPNSFE
jgi:acyl-CoA thioesterase-1